MSLAPPGEGVKANGGALGARLSGPLPGAGPLLLAVSGGADSVALVRLLAPLAPARKWRLTLAHVDHGLRPESGDDAGFVEALARDMGLAFSLRRVRVRAGGLSPEDAARRARRRALMDMAAEAGAGVIVLGHNRDDQAETLIMRMLTGTGPTGLAGMRPLAGPFWRPLLNIGREELRAYLGRVGQAWREDASNDDSAFLRNRVRGELLPLCRKLVNPRAEEALCRLAGLCADEEDDWRAWCQEAMADAASREGESLCLDRAFLRGLSPARLRRLLRHALDQLTGPGQGPDLAAMERLMELALGRAGRRLALAGGVHAYSEHHDLRLDPRGDPPGEAVSLWGPAHVILPGLPGVIRLEPAPEPDALPARGPVAYIPASRVRWPLVLRPAQPGERFHPLGAPGHKRLSRLLIDRKAPLWWRRRTVVAADAGGPWWAGPWAVAERARRRPSDRGWFRLSFVDTRQIGSYTLGFSETAQLRARSPLTRS